MNAAYEIESFDGKAHILLIVAESLADARLMELFRQVIDEALTAAGKIGVKSSRVFALSRIAQVLLTANQESEAESVANEALKVVQSIDDSYTLSGAMSYIIPILIRLGLKDEVLRVAREIKSVFNRGSVQKDLAEALIKMGQAVEALNVTNEIDNARIRSLSLSTIAQVLAESGKIDEALSTALKVEEAEERATTLALIAEAFAKAGQAEEALRISLEIDDWYQRVNAQTAAAMSWLDANCVKETKVIVDDVRASIGKINLEIYRSMSHGRLAILLAKLNLYRDAREVAEQCSRAADRLAAYTAILREYYIERDPNLAPLFAEDEQDENDLG